jgi:hypothetical protein
VRSADKRKKFSVLCLTSAAECCTVAIMPDTKTITIREFECSALDRLREAARKHGVGPGDGPAVRWAAKQWLLELACRAKVLVADLPTADSS